MFCYRKLVLIMMYDELNSVIICVWNIIIIRDVNFREFYFSIREFQISRLVEYSKLTRHSAWTTHLIHECCNTVGLDITPRGCGWAAAPGK